MFFSQKSKSKIVIKIFFLTAKLPLIESVKKGKKMHEISRKKYESIYPKTHLCQIKKILQKNNKFIFILLRGKMFLKAELPHSSCIY